MINKRVTIINKKNAMYGQEYIAIKEDKLYYLILLEKGGMVKVPKNVCKIVE